MASFESRHLSQLMEQHRVLQYYNIMWLSAYFKMIKYEDYGKLLSYIIYVFLSALRVTYNPVSFFLIAKHRT